MQFWVKNDLAPGPPMTVTRTGGSIELQNLSVDEVSGVDSPANSIPGWMVLKADKGWEVLKSRDGSPVRDDEGWFVGVTGNLINPLAAQLGIVKGLVDAKTVCKTLARIYSGNEGTYQAQLRNPSDGAALSEYNRSDPRSSYGPTGLPNDIAVMDPVSAVVDMQTLYDQHGPKRFHEAARMLPHHHLMQAAGHARHLGHPIAGPLLAAAADCAHSALPALHIHEAMDPSGPANRPVQSADAGELLEGVDLTTPTGMTIGQQRYAGFRPRVKKTKQHFTEQEIVHAALPGMDPRDPTAINRVNANLGYKGVQYLVAKLSKQDAASLACNERVHPAARRVLARRGRGAG